LTPLALILIKVDFGTLQQESETYLSSAMSIITRCPVQETCVT